MKQNHCANCEGQLRTGERFDRLFKVCDHCNYWWTDKTLALCHKHRVPQPKCTALSMVYEDNGTNHNDLLTTLFKWTYRSDTYYHELDHPVDIDPSITSSIKTMLKLWINEVNEATSGKPGYLPYDFSDQSTGWIRCSVAGPDTLILSPGWSSFEGYAVYPSDFRDSARNLPDFTLHEGVSEFRISTKELIDDINLSIVSLNR